MILLLALMIYLNTSTMKKLVLLVFAVLVKDTGRPADAVMGKIFANATLAAGPQSFFSMTSLAIW